MKTQASVNMASPTVDIICPTFNNTTSFGNFVSSFVKNTMEPWRLIIINNGSIDIKFTSQDPRIILLKASKNLGWMGGVNAGVKWALEHNPAKFIGWINDDVQITEQDCGWLTKMLAAFQKEGVGAVGPISNAIMGYQSFHYIGLPPYIEATRLSGMCFITKREVIEKVGLLDESLPGGDDLDYSLRVRQAGYKLCICRRTFIFHHYAQTGKRVHGDYWDSREHSEKINAALISKHGFLEFFKTINDMLPPQEEKHNYIATEENMARRELAEELKSGKVLDLGCGGNKIDPRAVGVDIRPSGALGVGYNSVHASVGEVACDVVELSPFEYGSVDGILAKHLLEHIIDVPKALKEWCRVLKDNGRLVIIVPDWRYCEAMACDPSHVHAFTPDSLKSIVESCGGFVVDRVETVSPGYVFMLSAHKVPCKVVNHNKMAVAA